MKITFVRYLISVCNEKIVYSCPLENTQLYPPTVLSKVSKLDGSDLENRISTK